MFVLLRQVNRIVSVNRRLGLDAFRHRMLASDDQLLVGGNVFPVSEGEAGRQVVTDNLLHFENLALLVVGLFTSQGTFSIGVETTWANHRNIRLILGIVEWRNKIAIRSDVSGRSFTVEVLNLVAFNAIFRCRGANDLEHWSVHPGFLGISLLESLFTESWGPVEANFLDGVDHAVLHDNVGRSLAIDVGDGLIGTGKFTGFIAGRLHEFVATDAEWFRLVIIAKRTR